MLRGYVRLRAFHIMTDMSLPSIVSYGLVETFSSLFVCWFWLPPFFLIFSHSSMSLICTILTSSGVNSRSKTAFATSSHGDTTTVIVAFDVKLNAANIAENRIFFIFLCVV